MSISSSRAACPKINTPERIKSQPSEDPAEEMYIKTMTTDKAWQVKKHERERERKEGRTHEK